MKSIAKNVNNVATKIREADLVKFCCNPDEYSMSDINVQYDIGRFFVTTTTHRHLMVHDKESGRHQHFPGPMMLHRDEGAPAYHFFF